MLGAFIRFSYSVRIMVRTGDIRLLVRVRVTDRFRVRDVRALVNITVTVMVRIMARFTSVLVRAKVRG